MSRHKLQPEGNQNLEITVGYDAPLDTFSAQVYLVPVGQEANDERDDNLLLWIATNYREIAAVEELAGAPRSVLPIAPGNAAFTAG